MSEIDGKRVSRGQLRAFLDESIQASRKSRTRVAVLMLTLLRADRIDAMFGTDPAEIMAIALERLPPRLRDADRMVRLADDKLCLVLPTLKSEAQAVLAANMLASVLEAPYVQGSSEAVSTIRVVTGIACYPDHASTAEQLVVNADIAERIARSRDLPHYVFRREDRVEVHAYLGLEAALKDAISANELELHYQPQVNLATGVCDGAEALLRWSPEERGAVSPSVLVRLAEENGLIGPLTLWIANTVVRHQAEWLRQGIDVAVSINLSSVNLADGELPDALAQFAGTWGADTSKITLEITESATIDDAERSLVLLRRLKSLGFKLSVDDFGTGYSSLSYVKRFPLDELKIDKLFIQHMLNSHGDQAIVRSVIDLAHNFGLKVVAEGVEDAATMDALRGMGCDQAQGYHLSAALPHAQFQRWFRDHTMAG
jgi:diguanylate cyclase (GGDEF)-like protein